MRSGEVLMLGDINIDTVWPVDKLPDAGHDAYVKTIEVGLGGAVLNTAIVLDRLGQPTGMLSCIGQDLWAAQALELMRQTGVNQDYIRVRPELASGLIFLAVTPDGERTMFSSAAPIPTWRRKTCPSKLLSKLPFYTSPVIRCWKHPRETLFGARSSWPRPMARRSVWILGWNRPF